MARGQCIGVREQLTSLLPDAELERLARETGMVQRRRKVKVAAFFWTLVLGFGAGRIRPIPGGHPNSSTCGHLKFPHPPRPA